MDIREAAIAALDNVIKSGAIEAAIEKKLIETITSCIANELATYSDFGKALTEKVKRSLALSGKIDLPSYNDAILKIVRRQVESRTNAVIQQQVAEQMENLLQPAPEEIKLTELVAQYIEHVKSRQDDCVCHGHDEQILLKVKDESFGGRTIELGESKDGYGDRLRHTVDITIGVNRDGMMYWLHFRNEDVEKRLFVGPLYGFERMLFQMKAAGSKIRFDADPHDIETTFAMEA